MLLEALRQGDTVFHYDKVSHAIIGASTVEAERAMSRERYGEDVLVREIAAFRRFTQPVSLDTLRSRGSALRRISDDLRRTQPRPHYFPFIWHGDVLRPAQTYIAKLPAAALQAVPELGGALDTSPFNRRVGRRVEPLDVSIRRRDRDPF